MAVQANGRLKKGKKAGKEANFDSQMNGHVVGRTYKQERPRKSVMGTMNSVIARIFIWYFIITTAFRCPSSAAQLSESSPKICKPYLNFRAYLTPYLDPYYQEYLAPHVEKVQPYVDTFNEEIYSPAAAFAKDSYETYAAPQVATAQRRAKDEWTRVVKPQVDAAQAKAREQYDAHLAQHVNKAADAASPYYNTVKTVALDTYQDRLIPAYNLMLPYAQQGYHHSHKFTVNVLFPNLQYAQTSALSFLRGTVWPHIRILYGANVEPQLMKISERLGRYKDSKKVEAAVKAKESSMSSSSQAKATTSASSSEVTSTVTKKKVTKSKTNSAEETPKKKKNYDRAEVEKKIKEDVRTWQTKFATGADKGAEELDERVNDITKRQIEAQVDGVGKSYLTQLEESAKSNLGSVKLSIIEIVQSTSADSTEEELEEAYEQAIGKVRAAGLTVREKAIRVRDWKRQYDIDTFRLVKAASDSTLRVLDSISDLGLQELGMKWAWTNGVTYQDWKLYHKLRTTFGEWRREVQDIAMKHEGLDKSKEASEDLENKAMDVASDTAKELARLKEVARWKIWAQDSSQDFSNREVPARAAKVAQQVMDKVEEKVDDIKSAVTGSSQGTIESVVSEASKSAEDLSSSVSSAASAGSDKADEAVSKASEAIIGTPPPLHESVASEASSSIESVASAASEAAESPKKVWGGAMAQQIVEAREPVLDDDLDDESATEKIQKVLNDVNDQAAEISRAISEALLRPTSTQNSVESVTSLASEQYEKAMSAASSALYGPEVGVGESLANEASARYSQAVTAASYAIYGTPTPVVESMAKEASARYNSATKLANEQYERAKARLLEDTADEPVHKQMLSSLEKGYSGALQAASSRLDSALKLTQSFQNILAPTQGPLESISSIASSRLSEGLSMASAQFSSATAAMNLEPTPAPRQYLMNAQRRYYEGVGVAHARYSEFVEAASSAVYGTPTPAYQSVLDAAQNQYSAAVAGASEQLQGALDSASSIAGATSKSPAQSVLDAASSQYDAAVAAASSTLSEASSRASVAVYGTPQGKVESAASVVSESAESMASAVSDSAESLASAASESAESVASAASQGIVGTEPSLPESLASQVSQNWETLVSKASEQIYGAPTPFGETFLSQAGEYGAQATEAAASQYFALQALVSDLVVGKEPDFTESVMSRLSSAYHTGYPGMASSASSYVSDAYMSASSVISTVFTPPPTLEAILEAASEQLNSVVDAASVQVYGTEKGTYEKASSAAAEAYSTAVSRASEAIHGSEVGYAEAAQSSIADVAASAQSAISVAIYGTPTGSLESALSSAASVYSSLSSAAEERASQAAGAAGDNYEAAKSKASEAVYGPEQGAMESAANRVAAAVESAKVRLAEFGDKLGGQGSEMYENIVNKIDEMGSQVSSAASSATERVRDEL